MPSTVVKSFGYDEARHALTIVFQTGRRYRYENVPSDVFHKMKASFSKGEFFNAYIRDSYRFVRIDDES